MYYETKEIVYMYLKYILRFLISSWISYASFSFIFLQTDPRLWEMWVRITYVCLNVVIPLIMSIKWKDYDY